MTDPHNDTAVKNTNEEHPKPETLLMAVTNSRRDANQQPGSNAHSGWLAQIRAGIIPSGEPQALPAAGKYIADLKNAQQRTGALRAAAIRAINKEVRHTDDMRLGLSFKRLHTGTNAASIEEQINVLPSLNRDSAVLVLDGLIGRCAKSGIPVNFYDLSRTLIYWGDSARPSSHNRRTAIVFDYHASTEKTKQPSNEK